MKQLFLIFFILFSTFKAFSQDTTYYDSAWQKVTSLQEASYYELFNISEADTNKAIELTYYKSGILRNETNFFKSSKWLKDGSAKKWNPNGILIENIQYHNNIINGYLLTFWENGNPKRKDLFENGDFVKGECFDSLGKKIKHFDYIIKSQFPGGDEKFMRYIIKNIKYPKKSRKNNIEGEVILKFVVNHNGEITNIIILQSVNDEIDEEAIRVLKNCPTWIPGSIDGKTFKSYRTLPIDFSIN